MTEQWVTVQVPTLYPDAVVTTAKDVARFNEFLRDEEREERISQDTMMREILVSGLRHVSELRAEVSA